MITLIGMGSGTPESLTAQGLAALQNAGLILGAKRLLEQLPQGCTDHRKALYQPEDVLAALAAELTGEEMSHLTALLQKPESAANAPQALADYIRIIREEHTKRTGGTDSLAAAMETYKDKKGYGGKRT